MLSCYGTDPDEATIKLLAEELLRKHTNEITSEEKPHEKATIKIFIQFLKKNSYNKEVAYVQWKEFLKWREEVGADSITESDYPHELSTNEAVWSGKDKGQRPCLIVTARLHQCSRTRGSGLSFQRFMIHTVEKGLQLADEADSEEVCVLYDRRGMEFDHIDTALARHCQDTVSMLQQWYSNRLGKMYILHLGTLYWVLYTFLLWPLFGAFLGHRLVVITDPADLLEHFNAEDLPENFIESGMTAPSVTKVSSDGTEKKDNITSATVNSTSVISTEDTITRNGDELKTENDPLDSMADRGGYGEMIEEKKIGMNDNKN